MKPHTSPFKFLDSYAQQDLDIFFGREQETESLYQALSGVKHLLVYGPSGAGKTSLIECGLRNQFSDADWYALSIRRGRNMLASTYAAINQALNVEARSSEARLIAPLRSGQTLSEAIQRLFSQRFQPIYLLYDQFEELLISGSQEEKETFFTEIDTLIRYRVPCRVLFIMREEFIGTLSEYEHLCPSIFENRFRLEKMTRGQVEQVIQSILEAEYYEDYFEVEQPEAMATDILSKLPDTRSEIDLSHVQVYLSELWDRALARDGTDDLPVLDQALIQPEDDLKKVLNSFLLKQLKELDSSFGEGLPLEVLAVMISERNTKLQVNEEGLRRELSRRQVAINEALLPLLDELETRRIIRKVRAADEVQYEISHDTLALVIGQNLTEEMRLRQKAEDIYRVYTEREGYFGQEDLDLLRPYRAYLPYPPELAQRISDSETYLREEEARQLREAREQAEKERALAERATQRTRIAVGVAVLALVAAIAAGNYYLEAEAQTELAEQEKENAEEKRQEAEANFGLAEERRAEADSLRLVAEQALADFRDEQNARLSAEDRQKLAEEQEREARRKNFNDRIQDIKVMIRVEEFAEAQKRLNQLREIAPNDPRITRLQAAIDQHLNP